MSEPPTKIRRLAQPETPQQPETPESIGLPEDLLELVREYLRCDNCEETYEQDSCRGQCQHPGTEVCSQCHEQCTRAGCDAYVDVDDACRCEDGPHCCCCQSTHCCAQECMHCGGPMRGEDTGPDLPLCHDCGSNEFILYLFSH